MAWCSHPPNLAWRQSESLLIKTKKLQNHSKCPWYQKSPGRPFESKIMWCLARYKVFNFMVCFSIVFMNLQWFYSLNGKICSETFFLSPPWRFLISNFISCLWLAEEMSALVSSIKFLQWSEIDQILLYKKKKETQTSPKKKINHKSLRNPWIFHKSRRVWKHSVAVYYFSCCFLLLCVRDA